MVRFRTARPPPVAQIATMAFSLVRADAVVRGFLRQIPLQLDNLIGISL
jgi:hypothetical protein